ncbi:MAG: septum formation protein Maf [Chitinophagales bacterium]|nr:septum formation protein Maf [Chitinophagales bacterium]
MHFDRPIILASKSPRRSQLLRESGFNFTVVGFDTDESFPEDMPAEEVAPMLAQRKARAGAHLIEDQEIILAADSVVILEGEVFNKPNDYDDAFRMLSRLSGNCHTVVTGVCLLSKTQEKVMAGVTKVWFAPLSEAEIHYYIETYKPYDKAGAYGAQEWIGHCKIIRIEGTYPNVMGLPVDLVYEGLTAFEQ